MKVKPVSIFTISLAGDIGNLFLDQETSDIVIHCQGEQIPAHKCILSARSPVFRAMMQANMLESIKREIMIEDVDNDVLKEMLLFIYTAEVDEDFSKTKDLLVLADKYEAVELVKYCGKNLATTLSNENALQLGVFAETHNAENLLKDCIHFVWKNMPDSLEKNWKEQIKDSPRMMMQMLQYSIDYHSQKVYEVFRVCQEIKFGWNTQVSGSCNSVIAFRVDSRIQLCGIGLYCSNARGGTLTFRTTIYDEYGKSFLDKTSADLKSNGSCHPVKFLFSKPITLEANKKYIINAYITEGQTYYVVNFSPEFQCNDPMPFKVTYLGTFTGTGPGILGIFEDGQIPSLYFSKCT